jgi:hypothetical protein
MLCIAHVDHMLILINAHVVWCCYTFVSTTVCRRLCMLSRCSSGSRTPKTEIAFFCNIIHMSCVYLSSRTVNIHVYHTHVQRLRIGVCAWQITPPQSISIVRSEEVYACSRYKSKFTSAVAVLVTPSVRPLYLNASVLCYGVILCAVVFSGALRCCDACCRYTNVQCMHTSVAARWRRVPN